MSCLLNITFPWMCSMSLHEGRKEVCLMFPDVLFSFSSATVGTGTQEVHNDLTISEHLELIILPESS